MEFETHRNGKIFARSFVRLFELKSEEQEGENVEVEIEERIGFSHSLFCFCSREGFGRLKRLLTLDIPFPTSLSHHFQVLKMCCEECIVTTDSLFKRKRRFRKMVVSW